jgi:hypothetical protein
MSDLLDSIRDAGLEIGLDDRGEIWVSPMKRINPKQLAWIKRNRKRLLSELETERLIKEETRNAAN